MDTLSIKTVLLVDDELDFCFLVSQALRKQGFRVISAHTLESAQKELIANNPTIVLLDHHLPNGLGTTFIKKNRLLLKGKYVVYITADQNLDLKFHTIGYNIFDFLPKPFYPSTLNKIIYLAASFN